MKIRGGIILGIVLLFVGLVISPATGGIIEACEPAYSPLNEDESVSVYFWDITGKIPEKQVIEMTESEWTILQDEIRNIKITSESLEQSLNGQFNLFKEYGFIEGDISYESLKEKANENFNNKPNLPPREPLNGNVILNAICAISFDLDDTSNTWVFGLNTFINLIGFDIISLHRGYSPSGINTLGGLLGQSTGPGNYIGFMFGFLGYWAGTKTATGRYSELIAAGFTVMTAWIPLP